MAKQAYVAGTLAEKLRRASTSPRRHERLLDEARLYRHRGIVKTATSGRELLYSTVLVGPYVQGDTTVLLVEDLGHDEASRLGHLVSEGSVLRRYEGNLFDTRQAAITHYGRATVTGWHVPHHSATLANAVFHYGGAAEVWRTSRHGAMAATWFDPRMSVWSAPRTEGYPRATGRWRNMRIAATPEPKAETAQTAQQQVGDQQTDSPRLVDLLRRAFSLPTSLRLPARLIAFYSAFMSVSLAALVWLTLQLASEHPILNTTEALFAVGGVALVCLELLLGLFADMRDTRHK